MKAALFGGSLDPVHREHVLLVRAAIRELNLDKVIVMPSYLAPHKQWGAHTDGADRLALCKIAFRGIPEAEVSDFELRAKGTSYSYLTCRAFAERYPDAERFFLLGADMLENFFQWKNPEEILSHVTLVACGRGDRGVGELHSRFFERFGKDYLTLGFSGRAVSSTALRVAVAFGEETDELDGPVRREIDRRRLYSFPQIAPALALEAPNRRAHSYRVAKLACARARSLGIAEEQALLAAALHDCGKSVPLDSPLLEGFTPPADVPEPVLHQYTGAYLAAARFGVGDAQTLDAIRYHTSGREGMSPLEALIYLSDLLEEGRAFDGVDELRSLFWRDLYGCLEAALAQQVEYLRKTGKPVYPLTEQAYRWILRYNHSEI